jgi:hypothetical protein
MPESSENDKNIIRGNRQMKNIVPLIGIFGITKNFHRR